MHEIEPYYNWEHYYQVSKDPKSPFYGKEYNMEEYSDEIYGYYIHPSWDYIGSETLYLKVLYVDYARYFSVIELFGEWNDTLNNDIMFLKRNVIDPMIDEGIIKFILIGENLMMFHAGEEDYYEEWFEEVGDGWIAAINLRYFIRDELCRNNLDNYINLGGNLNIVNWRTMTPITIFKAIDHLITRRLEA